MTSFLASIGLTALAGFGVSLVILAVALRFGWRAFLDHPNHRSLHRSPVPRIGGLGIAAGVIIGLLLFPPDRLAVFWFSVLAIFCVSLLDDVRDVSAGTRLIVQSASAAALVFAHLPPVGLISGVVAVVALVWMTNLFNFMDGADGLAAGMAVSGFAFLGHSAWTSGNASIAAASWLLAAASLAFLCFNFAPARVFLGDAGSAPLGFAAGALGVIGIAEETWPAWYPILVFSPFIMDATTTLAARFANGKNVFRAHREHYYQRLVRMGCGHRKTALMYYGLMVAAGVSALWALKKSALFQSALIAAWLVLYAVLMFSVNRLWKDRAQHEADACPV